MSNVRLDELQAVKIAGRNINNLIYADNTTLKAWSEEELKILLIKMKEESERVGLTLNNQKTKRSHLRSHHSWQIEGERVEAVKNFIFLNYKIMVTASMKLKDTCSLEG